ncbi:MAG TPA: DUF1501 domain-containing protein [Acidobacteriota bacterium]
MKHNRSCCDGSHARMPHLFGPGFSRRQFFRIAGSAVTGYYFTRVTRPIDILAQSRVDTIGSAKNCIFVFLGGAPSHIDTFDFKQTESTPADFQPETYNGITLSRKLLPLVSDQLDRITIVRSMLAKAAVHQLAQVWSQIGRNPTGPLGNISPHIGAVVALEMDSRRNKSDVLPGFVALNSAGIPGGGYFPTRYAPFFVNAAPTGVSALIHPDGMNRFNDRYALLQQLDSPLRLDPSPLGKVAEDLDDFAQSALTLMKNSDVGDLFKFATDERTRFGNNGFGDSCVVARNLLRANRGTRFIALSLGGWDMHQNIYAANNIYANSARLDTGLGNLLKDLRSISSPETTGKTLLDDTLIVMQGEFGRTVGKVTGNGGRDHYLRQFVLFAGANVRSYGVVGQTDSMGSANRPVEYGWKNSRDIRNEDVVATIYSALGIDWTTVRYDDPVKRGFEYVPGATHGTYEPVKEIFSLSSTPRGNRRVI